MQAERFSRLLAEKQNFLFIGETGSGKSEIALNTAAMLRARGARQVQLFDLDQSKAMFRARDAKAAMERLGISIRYMPQLLDTPVLVNGVIPQLMRRDSICLLDVGGNESAARMVGCLSDHLNGENTAAMYVLNPYRPWSGSVEDIRETMASILSACHIQRVYFLANPNVGAATSLEDFSLGLAALSRELLQEQLSAVFVKDTLYPFLRGNIEAELYPLRQYLQYP